ncbi:glycosyltransferase [Palaeococcus pacificus]|uniref:glycosyltransferase n=1 Tax=Palaeococcus pacificus TaxID=971279 RepID=UPI00064EE2F2|nr:glycosyltransferase family 2 protein [Palaeococcus pacificus]
MRISIIVPTYNERDNLEELFKRISGSLRGHDFEIVVVDDDSPDKTWEKAQKLSKIYPVKVIRRKNEKGLSSAVIRGFSEAEGDVFVVMDADLQHPPEVIPKLIERIENGADIAVASRYVKGGKVENWYWYRRLISKGAIMIGRVALPKIRHVRDPVSGFFALKREVVEGIELNPVGFKILLEILIKGRYSRIEEIPFTFGLRNAGESKLSQKQIFNYLRHLWRLMKWEGEIDRLVKFSIVGFTGVIVNEFFLWLFFEKTDLGLVLAGLFSYELSVLNNFLWNDIWTFRDLKNVPFLKRLVNFHLASIAGGAVQLAFLYGLTYIGIPYLISNLIGILISFIVRFIVSRHWAWG